MPTQEQKIDYIFETLKKREKIDKRNFYFKWVFRVFIIVYIYYFIMVGLPAMIKNFIPSFPSFGQSEENSMNGENINQDMLKKALDSYLNK